MSSSYLALLVCCAALCLRQGHASPRSCGPNQESRCVASCPPETTCANRHIQFSCLAVVEPCTNKCVCKKGYIKNHLGECITADKCASPPTCNEQNEEYTDAKRSCPPETCISIVAFFKCDSNQPSEAGCVCKPGYLRRALGSPCLPTCECPQMRNAPECQNGH